MSEQLPTTAKTETPLLTPSDISTQQPNTPPDLSNPYAYAGNPIKTTLSTEQDTIPLNDENPATTFNSSSNPSDPEVLKLKSSIWKKAGQLQSAIGSLTGLESWQTSGKKTEQEAERELREAQDRLNQGEASRVHGEYERMMGYVSYAIGHVAGDAEMQSKASERTEHGAAEVDRSIGKH
ncbi:hypothetical protein V8B55DRAFT_1477069 [Mucor lusitanicus]|uniref:Uncharacterized protein n=1 Tax=Mucor lusitanicus CBS 277.49 TaxID=747725 RepID=A0A162TXP7_MUCCL|nr:hypothetical protein MUCCIDRAFT_77098 [Mucor lusitanicus CBS 277.49]